MTPSIDSELTDRFAKKLREAEERLWADMRRHGLVAEDGWKIMEVTRERNGGSELVLRPFHRHLTAPADLECVVLITETARVEVSCNPAT